MTAPAMIGAFDALASEEPYPGVHRVAFSCEQATVTRYRFLPGARFPIHHHPQEQITLIEEGRVELSVADERRSLGPGEYAVVAADVEHGITAGPEGARFVAVVVPRRATGDAYEVVSGGEAPAP